MDDSRFSLTSDCGRIHIWKERGRRNHPSKIIESALFGNGGVLVWRGIMHDSHTDPNIFQGNSVTCVLYCTEILLPHIRLFSGVMGSLQRCQRYILSHSGCRTPVWRWMYSVHGLARKVPGPKSSEHMWDILRRRLTTRHQLPATIPELRLAQQEEWAAIHLQFIDNLVHSMN